jgi:hypothetical protein
MAKETKTIAKIKDEKLQKGAGRPDIEKADELAGGGGPIVVKVPKDSDSDNQTPLPKDEMRVRLPKDVPDTLLDFQSVMVKFAVDPAWADSITDFIADTGSPLIFEDPYELLTKLIQFPQQVNGFKRNAIIKYWVSTHKLHETDDYLKMVAKEQKELIGQQSDDSGEPQVKVIEGKIVPSEKEQSLSQAKKVLAATGGTGGDGKGSDEGKFTVDENGDPIAIPGAKLSQSEAIVLGSIKQRRAAGDTRNAFEIFTEDAGKLESFKQALGIPSGGGGGNPFATPEGMESMKKVFGGDETTRLMITQMQDNFNKSQENIVNLIKTINEKPKEDPAMAEMKAALAAQTAKLEAEREERHKMEREQDKTQIEALRGEIRAQGAGKQATDAYGIMGKGIDKISEGLNKATDKIGELMTRGGNPNLIPSQPPQQKNALTAALSAEARKATASSKLGAQLFERPAQPPPQPPPAGPPTIPFTEQG